MQIIAKAAAWLRAWVSESVAIQIAERAERHSVLIGEYADDLAEQIEKLTILQAAMAGPSPASDGLSLAVLRSQICELQTIAANHKASLTMARDAADARGKRIAELESLLNVTSQHVTELMARLAHFEDKFAARTDLMCAPSLN